MREKILGVFVREENKSRRTYGWVGGSNHAILVLSIHLLFILIGNEKLNFITYKASEELNINLDFILRITSIEWVLHSWLSLALFIALVAVEFYQASIVKARPLNPFKWDQGSWQDMFLYLPFSVALIIYLKP